MEFRNLSYDEHVNKELHITAQKKYFHGNTGIHFHEFFEIEIMLGGSGIHMLNGEEIEIKRGMIYMLSPADFHVLKTRERLELYNVMFDESIVNKQLLTRLFGKWENRCFFLNEADLAVISSITDMLISENNSDDAYKEAVIRSALELLIINIIRRSGIGNEEESENTVINQALRYIYTHLRDNPTLSSVAAACNYTPNYFSKLFYEFTGKKYVDYISNLKITNCKMLLACSNMSIPQIADECGFGSHSNFYKVFRERTGETPASYRKRKLKV